jgi:hypothetical protein
LLLKIESQDPRPSSYGTNIKTYGAEQNHHYPPNKIATQKIIFPFWLQTSQKSWTLFTCRMNSAICSRCNIHSDQNKNLIVFLKRKLKAQKEKSTKTQYQWSIWLFFKLWTLWKFNPANAYTVENKYKVLCFQEFCTCITISVILFTTQCQNIARKNETDIKNVVPLKPALTNLV